MDYRDKSEDELYKMFKSGTLSQDGYGSIILERTRKNIGFANEDEGIYRWTIQFTSVGRAIAVCSPSAPMDIIIRH